MGFKTLSLNAAIATAVVAGSAVAISPAQAATLTPGSFTLTPPSLTQSGSNFQLNFSGSVTSATGGLSGLLGTPISQVVALSPSGGSNYALTGVFTNFLSRTVGGNTISIDLLPSTFELLGTFPGSYVFGTNALNFRVNYNGQPDLSGVAAVSASSSSLFRSASFTAAQAIPTPALVPGLVSLGLLALRKRKSAAAQELV